jgi:hypothetical protein
MMLAWSFAARTVDEVAALLRALGRHRYVRECEHALHFTVIEALADDPRFRGRGCLVPGTDPASRDPSLWIRVDVEDAIAALARLWGGGADAEAARRRLANIVGGLDLPHQTHDPFQADPDDPPHPELVLLDWELYPICELDPERHAGAVRAMELAKEEVDVSAPVYQEAVTIALPELVFGGHNGVLLENFVIWSDGPYSYADYVFCGAARAAKLVDAPVGPRDEVGGA